MPERFFFFRGKALLGYTDGDVINKSGYDLVHYDDITYVAQAHQERRSPCFESLRFSSTFNIGCHFLSPVLKTGASGLIAYRLVCKDSNWQWLQTSTRMLYKNSKPDFIICTHRPLVSVLLIILTAAIADSVKIAHVLRFLQ